MQHIFFLEQNALLKDQHYLPYITFLPRINNPREKPSAHAQPFNKRVVLCECDIVHVHASNVTLSL